MNFIDKLRAAADARGRDRINASRSRWIIAQIAGVVVFALAAMFIFTQIDDAEAAHAQKPTSANKCISDTGDCPESG